MRRLVSIFLLITPLSFFADQSIEELSDALTIAAYWDQKQNERFPTTYNHTLSTGYFVTPSARMTEEGEIGLGIAAAPPYLNWNARIQPFSFLELSANYRVFRGYQDPTIGHLGFGDYADRGANFKLSVITPELSIYKLPGLAVGIDDFMGSKKFTTYYIVGTQVWPELGLEGSFGWGAGRYTHGPSGGFFGGFNWFPLYSYRNKWVQGFCFTAEFDPTHYHNDPHPHGRESNTPINFGAKYNFCDLLELSASCLRGKVFAAAGSVQFNWGKTEGLLPKISDPCPYTSPVDREPLGCIRLAQVMIQSMSYALDSQGFQLTKSWLDNSTLWLRLMNCRYRQEHLMRIRLQHLLAALTPSNIETVVVEIESNGLVCQQYVYPRALLLRYVGHCITPFEFDLLTPREEACSSPPGEMLFNRKYPLWRVKPSPRLENFFGSASGKYKYDLGVKLDIEGFLPFNWFYEVQISNTLFSNIQTLSDFDFFSPSQLPNVATDYIRYRQSHALSWDRLYLQKSLNLGRGFFGRVAGGYFQINYAGVAAESLWYPAHSHFAIGLEGAVVKKRRYTGLGFQSTLRHFEGRKPIYSAYSTLQQYFLNLYFDIPELQVFTKISLGQFLAKDKGIRGELTRYFDNGIRLTGWMTLTNAGDQIHGENYYDRGIAIEIPFDLFFKCSSRRIWNYALAAWLRDAGYSIWTGRALFETLNRERRW